jgi:NADPH-dependent glutamate synthase beta subunit-like oxidoreductase/NAD-dependent dihydropyrimidine dehydrogenase PreA subunit
MVIGATPAGLVATNKLGELGIPVTLVDSDVDLDQKLCRAEWRLNSGMPLNHAHRPGLIRILRNPGIHCIMPAEVTSIKHNPQGFRVRLNRLQTFVDAERCTLCGRCLELCPVSGIDGLKAIGFATRRSLPGRAVIDKRRKPLCQANCPLEVNAQGYIALARAGRFYEALDLIRRDNVLPGICGRVCTHPCELGCRRGELDEPVAVRDIKRFVADYERSHPRQRKPVADRRRPEKVAVVGSGPAGLAAAADLARYGYQVTVYEKENQVGGLLRYGIGPHRLPRDILDADLAYIESLGVAFVTSRQIDLGCDLDRLRREADAVILTTGTWSDRPLGVPGEDLEGVESCLAFLNRLHRGEFSELQENVAVIGDGNAAFDLARTLVRLGANVTILSWFPDDLIPADDDEMRAAREEGIVVQDRTQVVAFLGRKGRLERVRCKPTKPGEPDAAGIPWPVIVPGGEAFERAFDRVFVAIGQAGAFQSCADPGKIGVTASGFIQADADLRTTLSGVYAAGDAVSGPATVVEAMAAGRKAARTVHADLSGEAEPRIPAVRPQNRDFPEIPTDIPSQPRPSMPERQPSVRRTSFAEVALGLNEAQVVFEAERCLQCGVCAECLQCVEACASIGAVNHGELAEERTEHTGVVIVADPAMAPAIKGEDVIRAYGPRAAKSDVHAMLVRGFAAAAEAVILLGGASQRPRGRGISFSLPEPGLSPDIRLGVFVCRCNDALGWLAGMGEYIERLGAQEDVVHTEVLSSACTPEASTSILRTIREKGITRVLLASCLCCPLDFVCSSCTDQRSRLKQALFTATGVSRSMFEMCDLRGEVLRLVRKDPSLAMERFTGLIDRSLGRARRLKPLPAPLRTYNFTTAVIGESEAAMTAAHTLAEAGLEVFLFGASDKPLTRTVDHPNVRSFKGSSVRGLRGTLGDFQVFVNSSDAPQAIQVGTVILGERSRKRSQYLHQEGLPARIVTSAMQEKGVPGVPFLYPGTTSIPGLFLADPPGINVSKRKKGAAAAILVAAVMPRGPRQSKGFTVVVDETLCRGCGRCIRVCPYQAISLHRNGVGGWCASVDEALCKGCGNCISVCPSNAADSPYRDQAYLEQMLGELLGQ